MENFGGSDVQVVLSLKEGKGFDRISNCTSIVATLNGQSLETGSVDPDPVPCYATDLVWKADKNVLRKMRSGQVPLKIECFEIKENETRDKIGHLLLSLRSARIILPRDGDIDVPASWHKFFYLRSDLRAEKPQISLALTIEEHEAYVRRVSRKESMESSNNRAQRNFSPNLSNKIASPYTMEEEGLIQLGPVATCRSLFLLNIIAGTAQNLHLLREETRGIVGNYSLWYRVLENDVQLKSFATLEKRWTLDEKAVIRIRSSLGVLRSYLRERPNFILIMQQRDTIVGHSEIDLGPLIPAEITEDSLRNGENIDTVVNHRCILNGEKTPRNIGDSQDNEAFLDLQLRLVYVGSKKSDEPRRANNSTEIVRQTRSADRFERTKISHEAPSEMNGHGNSCGDFGKFIVPDYGTTGCKYLPNNDSSNRDNSINLRDRVPLPRSVVTPTNSCNAPTRSISVEPYHCYCLNVNLVGIKLSSSIENVELRFHHPKAEIISTLCPTMPLLPDEKLKLGDIGWKLHFISVADEIRQLLLSFPPRVSVRDVASENKECAGQTILDVDPLFAREKHESQYEMPIYDGNKREIGTIDVAMYLEDRGPYYGTHRPIPGENLGPPIVDDSLAYKIVEELEAWRERQREIFLAELRKKEERHLDRLSDEWQKRRENLESKLACSVEQCKMLANSLNKATEDLRTRRLKSLENEARLIKANEDLQWRYDNNIRELQEASRRMQEELASKVNILQEQKNKAVAEIEPLRLDNERLGRLTSKQAEEIETSRKGSLTQDQTASLLQDVKALEQKLANTQKSKSFFKEQWGKAVREIHRMKIEHQQAIEVQIKTSKDELKNLDLEEMLCADSSSLTNDQIMLGQIQKEIDVIKPRSTLIHADTSSHRSFFPPIDTVYSQRATKSHRGTAKSEEQDERLRTLIEERDSLIKTGSYTIDDGIIIKLNAEIRSLLISN